jgi:hypothetical protein
VLGGSKASALSWRLSSCSRRQSRYGIGIAVPARATASAVAGARHPRRSAEGQVARLVLQIAHQGVRAITTTTADRIKQILSCDQRFRGRGVHSNQSPSHPRRLSGDQLPDRRSGIRRGPRSLALSAAYRGTFAFVRHCGNTGRTTGSTRDHLAQPGRALGRDFPWSTCDVPWTARDILRSRCTLSTLAGTSRGEGECKIAVRSVRRSGLTC